MSHSYPTIDILPDEVLATILKLVADLPAASQTRQHFPVSASRVSRRWRIITFAYPELWANIRISPNWRSRKLAAMFVERSGSFPLDISVNTEAYVYKRGQPHQSAHLPLSKVLSIIGPHIGRWRSIAFRGWDDCILEFCEFLRNSSMPASRLEYIHLSTIEVDGYASRLDLGPLEIPGNRLVHSLRVNSMCAVDGSLLQNLQSLDITMSALDAYTSSLPFIQPLLGPASGITTLVIRGFYVPRGMHTVFKATTVRSLALSSYGFFHWNHTQEPLDLMEALTNTFVVPNLDYLEIVLSPSDTIAPVFTSRQTPLKEPPFPNLRTLRLEGARLTPSKLARLERATREITNLELLYTTDNHHLLSFPHHGGGVGPAWPLLHSLTVETPRFFSWLPAFAAQRTALGPGMGLTHLTLSPWPTHLPSALAATSRYGITDGFIDGFGRGFFFDEYDQRVVDFEYVKPPVYEQSDSRDGSDPWCWACRTLWIARENQDRFEEEIEERLGRASTALAMATRCCKERRRESRKNRSAGIVRSRRSAKRPRIDILEDFYVV
ncbi:hypothetical protein C8R46DRAFT_1064316 [Mycena filopes]|nr:hypothetical protein C8R46DRAFT_1064316 [Mycena filopes]